MGRCRRGRSGCGGGPCSSSESFYLKVEEGATFVIRTCVGHGKYGCRKVRVYPTKFGRQLGRDPSKKWELQLPCFEGFFWAEILVPASFHNTLGYACTLYTPTFPLLIVWQRTCRTFRGAFWRDLPQNSCFAEYQESPRQTKPKKGPKRKVHENFAHFCANSGVFP